MAICTLLLFLGLYGATPASSARAEVPEAGTQTCSVGTSTIADCFPDSNLASRMAQTLGKGATDVFTSADSRFSSSLSLNRAGIRSLDGIQQMTEVTFINLSDNSITDISPLSSMTQLTNLNLNNNQITDLGPLRGLTNLTMLQLSSNQITDLTPLEGMGSKLDYLDLVMNQIQDAGPLGALTNIHTLNVSGNAISDASPFAKLANMVRFEAYGNKIADPAPFAKLNKLETLNLGFNMIGDLSKLDGFRGMTSLYIVNLTQQLLNPANMLADRNQDLEVHTAIVDANAAFFAPVTNSSPDGGSYLEAKHAVVWPSRAAGSYTVDFSYDSVLPTSASYTYSGWVQQDVDPSVTVTYDSQGGSPIPSQLLAVNGVIGEAKPVDPVRNGYLFVEWTKDRAGSEPFDFMTPVDADMTLYAQWRNKPTTPTTPTDPTKPGGHTGGTTAPDPARYPKQEQVLARTGTSWICIAVIGLSSALAGGGLSVAGLRARGRNHSGAWSV